jgi:hypothetical protein
MQLVDKEGARQLKRHARAVPTVPISPTAELLTRIQAARYLTDMGYPIAIQTLAYHGMAANRPTGPPIAGVWGRRMMYRPADLLAWARARAGLTDQSNV